MNKTRFWMVAVVVLSVMPAEDVLACSCAGSDLEDAYESSANVFTAVVTSGSLDDDGNIEAGFEVTEVFKGDIPFDRLGTRRSGTSCDTTITVGPEYLFFLEDEGRFGGCSIRRTIVPGRPEPWVDLLRAYQAGDIPDMSSPWRNYEHDGLCTLRTNFRATQIRIQSYVELQYRFATAKVSEPPEESMKKEGYANAAFMLPTRGEPDGAEVVLQTLNETFVAKWFDGALKYRIREGFRLTGDDVLKFAEELLVTPAVTLEGELARDRNLEGTVIRTTNAGNGISDFVRCAQQ